MFSFLRRREHPQPDGLLSVLLSRRSKPYEREYAAMDLGAYDEEIVEVTLAYVGARMIEDKGISKSCGVSLGDIWRRAGAINQGRFLTLNKVAKSGVIEEVGQEFSEELQKLGLQS